MKKISLLLTAVGIVSAVVISNAQTEPKKDGNKTSTAKVDTAKNKPAKKMQPVKKVKAEIKPEPKMEDKK